MLTHESRQLPSWLIFDVSQEMKPFAVLILLFLALPAAHANLYLPNAKLAGETVRARILKDTAAVTAVFEFEDWITRDSKIVYLPVFASHAVDPVPLLASIGFELEIGGKKLGVAAPCEAPSKFESGAQGHHVFWFAANLDELATDTDVDALGRVVIKVSYSQPLIRGYFFYLPVIVGQDKDRTRRDWRYQMHIHSGARVVHVVSKSTDHEQLADGVVVYLKDGEIVAAR